MKSKGMGKGPNRGKSIVVRTCRECGKPIEPKTYYSRYAQAIFCSRQCSAQSQRVVRRCEQCGAIIGKSARGHKPQASQRYCSRVCGGKARSRPTQDNGSMPHHELMSLCRIAVAVASKGHAISPEEKEDWQQTLYLRGLRCVAIWVKDGAASMASYVSACLNKEAIHMRYRYIKVSRKLFYVDGHSLDAHGRNPRIEQRT